MLFNVFGKTPSAGRLKRIEQSPNYRNGVFQNLQHTSVMRPDASYPNMLHKFLNKPADVVPHHDLPSVRTDLKNLDDKLQIVWFGHSSYLIHAQDINILVDPVFSGNASPVSFFARAFPGTDVYGVDDMPEIDMLILTHDHYDHLDYKTIVKLKKKVKHVFTAMGVGAHLEYWGYPAGMITELDWYESANFSDKISITATPARHFSGRLIRRGQTLWASFVLDFSGKRVFAGGDSGYGKHFKQIGDQFGPFDVALLECGQYNEYWPHIHMMPEETVQAGIDLGAHTAIPVHWGKFALSVHPWDEPVKRIVKESAKRNFPVIVPTNGLPVVISQANQ